MVGKRTYKALTKAQTSKLKTLTKQGLSQGKIAKALGVSKQRIATGQKKAKIGVRVKSPFWKDVKLYKEKAGVSHKRATKEVMNWKEWGTKRAKKAVWYDEKGKRHVGKKWKSYRDRQDDMRALRDRFEGEELHDAIQDELDEYSYGDTPK